MYERRHQHPLPRRAFLIRVVWHLAFALALLLPSLAIGMAGYLWFEPENIKTWRDAFLNAAMLLGGMGPVENPQTDAGKVFAGLYALFAGIIFISTAGIIIAPLLHRLLHLFHWDKSSEKL